MGAMESQGVVVVRVSTGTIHRQDWQRSRRSWDRDIEDGGLGAVPEPNRC